MPRTRGEVHPATEKQIKYARDLGLKFPQDVTIGEISDLLDRRLSRDKAPSSEHLQMADAFGVEYTDFTGKRDLFGRIVRAADATSTTELCRWFAFRVCRDMQKNEAMPMLADLTDSALYRVAEELAADESVVRSIRRSAETDPFIWWGTFTTDDGRSLTGGSRNTKAYKAAKAAVLEAELLRRGTVPHNAGSAARTKNHDAAGLGNKHETLAIGAALIAGLLILAYLLS